MKGFQKLLFIYSLLIFPLAFLLTAFFAPKPQNFFLLILFSPLAFFAWGKFLKKKGHKAFSGLNTTLAVMAIVTILISGITVSYFYSKSENESKTLTDSIGLESVGIQAPSNTSEPINKSTSEQLQEIKDELTLLRAEQRGLSQILGISTSAEDIAKIISSFENEGSTTPSQEKPAGYITISDAKYSLVDVYEQSVSSSKIVGQIEYGKNYPYFSKVGSWYEIKLLSNEKAWTNFAYLKEVQNQ